MNYIKNLSDKNISFENNNNNNPKLSYYALLLVFRVYIIYNL